MTAIRGLDPDALEREQSARGPWSSGSVERLVLTNTAALGLVLVGWAQAAGTHTLTTALMWLNVGLVGLGLAGVGNGLWLLRGRRAVTLASRAVVGHLPAPAAIATAPATDVIATDGTRRYHRPGCPLVAGRPFRHGAVRRFEGEGRTACEACRP
jgi:hypothetical protein